MSFKEVNELRKSGKLEEALKMALSDLESLQKDSTQELNPALPDVDLMKIQGITFQRVDNKSVALWAKRALAWVYYEYLKINCKPEKYSLFKDYLLKIKELHLSEDEKMVFDNCAWQIGSIIFLLQKQDHIDNNKINEIFEIIKNYHFTKPSESYSFLHKAFHKLSDKWDKYPDFADWWSFENFRSEDYLKEEFNGRQILSIAERAYIAYSKKLLEGEAKETDGVISPKAIEENKIKEFLPKLDSIIEMHPEYQYPPYYKAKLLLALGDKENFLSALLPFAKKRKNDFWVWEVIADAFPVDSEEYFACLCKSVLCKTSDEFLVKVMQKLAETLIQRNFLNEAKYFIKRIIVARNENSWNVPVQILNWQKQKWFEEAELVKDINPFLQEKSKMADEILFYDLPEEIIVIEHVNKDRKLVSFINEKKNQGFFNYEGKINHPKIGEVYKVRLKQIGNEGYFHSLTISQSDLKPPMNLIRNFHGSLKLTAMGFAFVDDIIIPSFLLDKKDFRPNDLVTGISMVSFNKKKNEWGWKAINISTI